MKKVLLGLIVVFVLITVVNSRIIFVGVPGKFLLGKEEEQEKILQYFCG